MRWIFIISVSCISATLSLSQESVIRGTVTYITGDAVYVSIGRDAGVEDSSLAWIISYKDTITQMRVFAVSSKSSAMHIITSQRQLRIGDEVQTISRLENIPAVQPKVTALPPDSSLPRTTQETQSITNRDNIGKTSSIVSVHGRIGLQYSATKNSNALYDIQQPGLTANIRGAFTNFPVKFEFYGNIRSLARSGQTPFGSGSVNQTKIYRLSVDYDDSVYRFGIGRIIPQNAPSVGYIDGLIFERTLGLFRVGIAGGFEPNFSQQKPTTDRKKITLFANFRYEEGWKLFTNIAYAKTYDHSLTDREVFNTSITFIPTDQLYFLVYDEIDLRRKSGADFILKPVLSSVNIIAHYRPIRMLSLGLGLTSWRPVYSYSTIQAIPDSMLDSRLRTSPNFSIHMFLPHGITCENTYSPRSSDQKFGKEYADHFSAGISNLFSQNISVRGMASINSSTYSTSRSYGVTVQKSFIGFGDIGTRFLHTRITLTRTNEIQWSNSLALDFTLLILNNFAVTGSVERFINPGFNGYYILSDISWRF